MEPIITKGKNPESPERNEIWALASLLSGRYGALALTRAAGEAAAAQRKGDQEQMALWHSVIADLRQAVSMGAEKA